MTTITLSPPDAAAIVELTGGVYRVIGRSPSTAEVPTARYVTHTTYTTTLDAWNAIYALDPTADGTFHFGRITLTENNVTNYDVAVKIGDTVTLKADYTESAGTKYQTWEKLNTTDGKFYQISGATGSQISDTVTAAKLGTYRTVIYAQDAATNRISEEVQKVFSVTEAQEPTYASDAIGGVDPYGYINTGRGGGPSTLGGDDLNLTYISLINTTYAVSDLELYVPSVSTTMSYDASLPAPYQFDSSGNVFNGTDYEMQIRVAATGTVLHTLTVPEVDNNVTEYWY